MLPLSLFSSRSFNPSRLGNLQLWLKASTITGLADGDAITTWADQSGNNRDATQATAARKPLYKINILNGKAVVRFDGVDDRLNTAAFQAFPQKRGTIFVVATMGTVTGDRAMLGPEYTGVAIGWELAHSATTSLDLFWYDDVASAQIVDGAPTGTSIWEVVRTSDTSLTGLRNGTADAAITITDNQPTSEVLTVGASRDALDFWNSDIAEIIIYGDAKSAADRKKVRRYLSREYAITLS